MTNRPILFSADMVNAILAGRKTQARRVAKLTDAGHLKEPRGHRRWHPADAGAVKACPYGQPGDRLWVKETWFADAYYDRAAPSQIADSAAAVRYAADGYERHPEKLRRGWGKVRQSIFMMRWASRITLKVTGVLVERLRDISDEDAHAEGVTLGESVPARINGEKGFVTFFDPVRAFAALWDRINGKRPGCDWKSNPWVWVVELEREQADD